MLEVKTEPHGAGSQNAAVRGAEAGTPNPTRTEPDVTETMQLRGRKDKYHMRTKPKIQPDQPAWKQQQQQQH